MDGTASLATQPGMGTWLIILLLFLFLLGGNNGFGFGNNGNAGAFMAGVASQDRGPSNAELLINNNTMWQNQMFDNQNLANQTTLITQGFCNTNNSIEKAILAGQQNTAAIIASGTANTQKVLDMLCNQEIAQLRSELTQARNSISNNVQTQYLISQLRPYPIPSFTTTNPVAATTA